MGGGGDGGGGEGGGGDGSSQNGTPKFEKPAKRKLRPVVQQAVMAKRTWKWSVDSNMAITDRALCSAVSE